MYRGEDVADKFVRDLQKEAKQLCYEYIATPKKMRFSTEDSLSFTKLLPVTFVQNRLLTMIEFVTTVTLLGSTAELLIVLAI